MAIVYWIIGLYPSLKILYIEEPTTLRDFIKSLGRDYLYAHDMRAVGILVNNRRLWDSATLRPGDKVVIFPIAPGG